MENKVIESIKSDISLSKISHINIGGQCENLFVPENIEQISKIYETFADHEIIPIGGCSNILFGNNISQVLISDQKLPKFIEITDDEIIVSANININYLIKELQKYNLGGFEFLSGIPAHIGGLTKMNAGAYGKQFCDFIEYIRFVDIHGNVKKMCYTELHFQYRKLLLDGFIVEIALKKIPTSVSKSKELVNKRILC